MEKGTNISHYKILEKLGEGGMGVVYKARDTKLGRTVVLKFLPSHFTDSEQNKERFIREAKTAATLNHTNICTIYSIDEYKGQQFISMEYIDGSTLREKLRSDGLQLSTVLKYAKQIADALSEAHDKGIVHRDIKPENIMVDAKDRIKVTDFGLARVHGTRNLTKEGRIVGTLAYMSPEQIQHGEADERSDLFSFGIVLYEMLTGIHPFEGEYEQATGFKLVNENPALPSSIRPEIPPGIEDIVLRCLEKERDQRYGSARYVFIELEGESSWPLQMAATNNGIGRSLLPLNTLRFNRKTMIWIITAVVLLFLALGGWFFSSYASNDLPEEKHIVVLPFDNLSPEVFTDNILDGIMEVLTSKITRMEIQHGSLWVVPSSEVHREQVPSVSDAKRLFGVTLAVTGSLQGDREHYRLTINLIDANSLRVLRAEVLERDSQGINFVNLQDDVVGALTRMLEIELGPGTVENILAGNSEDPRANQLYIDGKVALSRFENPVKIDSAIVLFKEAIEADPEYALAYAGLAEAYWRKYDLTRDTQWTDYSRKYAEKAMDLSDRLPEVTITLALMNNGMGRYKETLKLLDGLEENDRRMYDALVQKAQAYEDLGQLDEAEEIYRQAIEQKKNYWDGYNKLGVFYNRNSRFEEAAEAFRKVTELTPDNTRGYSNLGGAYFALNKQDKAIEAFEQSLSIQSNSRAFSNLGTYYIYQKKYSEAIHIYEQAIKHRDTDYRFWGNLGIAYYYAREDSVKVRETMQRAIELAERDLEVNPNHPDLLGDLAGYHLTIGNTDHAERLLRQLISLDVLIPENQAVIGHLYARLGNRDSAMQWFERALENGFPLDYIEAREEMKGLLKDPRMDTIREQYHQ